MPQLYSNEFTNQPLDSTIHKNPVPVFVTGGTGLVGSHLIKTLAKQQQPVVAIYRRNVPEDLRFANVEWIEADILDPVALEQAMQHAVQVYHCAAIVSFSPANKYKMFKTNVEGTANVVNAALNKGVKRMVFVSSVSAMGRLRKQEIINETMNWSKETSNSNYGESKFLAEMEVWRGIGEGLEAVIVNPSIILGNGDWNKGSAGIFKSAYNEFPWYSDGAGGFVDVHDVVHAMMGFMDSEISGQRFIVSGENKTYQEIFTLAANAFSKKPPHKKVTPFLAGLIWRLEALKATMGTVNPLLTKETANTAMTRVEFDNSKLLKYLPNFQYTPLIDTINRVCREMLAAQNTTP